MPSSKTKSKNSNKNEKSKLLLLIIASLGLGILGIDRFYAGDTTMGIIKLLTMGGLGIWAFIDWIIILINALTQSKNGVFTITKWNDNDEKIVFYVAIIILIMHAGILPNLIMGLIGLIIGGIATNITSNIVSNVRSNAISNPGLNTTSISINGNTIFE